MPNHVRNIIKIRSTTDERAAEIVAAICNADGVVDFNTLIPMPADLNCGDEDYDAAQAAKGIRPIRPLTESQRATAAIYTANIEAHGYATWYDWSCDKWGTKWNAYQCKIDGRTITFETAWSAPHPVYTALAAKFPDLECTVYYADENMGHNCGVILIGDGKVKRTALPKTPTDAFMLAGAVWGVERVYFYEDDGE